AAAAPSSRRRLSEREVNEVPRRFIAYAPLKRACCPLQGSLDSFLPEMKRVARSFLLMTCLPRRRDGLASDTVLEALPDRRHGLDPGVALAIGQRADLDPGGGKGGAIFRLQLGHATIGLLRNLGEDLQELVARRLLQAVE